MMQTDRLRIGILMLQAPEKRDHAETEARHRKRRPNPGKRRTVERKLGPEVCHGGSIMGHFHPGVVRNGTLVAHKIVLGATRFRVPLHFHCGRESPRDDQDRRVGLRDQNRNPIPMFVTMFSP